MKKILIGLLMDTAQFLLNDVLLPKKDSISPMTVTLSQQDSTSNLLITPNKIVVADSVSTIPLLKKPRGVPMGNNDYKI